MYRGVYVPLVTPLRGDGAVCGDSVARLIEFVGAEASGFIPCLSTGEGWALSDAQWHDMIQQTLARAGLERVIAGIEVGTTEAAAEKAIMAAELGCTAIIATKPIGAPIAQDEIIEHYRALGERSGLDVFVYNESWLSQNTCSLDTLMRLRGVPRIAGIKESTGRPEGTMSMLRCKNMLPPLFQGREELVSLSEGFDGYMLSLGNLYPALCVDLLRGRSPDAVRAIRDQCTDHNLCSERWYSHIKVELYRRRLISTPCTVSMLLDQTHQQRSGSIAE